ncbi:MAG: hypothetical protein A4E42_00139 [Methanoregulaceae archaeon PtaU1.Bin222]|nr:MAG: hypothetical protein A4E42_00139 [Methanoregulaceae archaeon PtaU1.Bin222]
MWPLYVETYSLAHFTLLPVAAAGSVKSLVTLVANVGGTASNHRSPDTVPVCTVVRGSPPTYSSASATGTRHMATKIHNAIILRFRIQSPLVMLN